jgi:hypothetical protein
MNITPSNNSTLIGYNEIFLNLKKLYVNAQLPNKIIFLEIAELVSQLLLTILLIIYFLKTKITNMI